MCNKHGMHNKLSRNCVIAWGIFSTKEHISYKFVKELFETSLEGLSRLLCTQLRDLMYGCTTRHVHVRSTSWPCVRLYCSTCTCAFNSVTFCTTVLHDVFLYTALPDLLYGSTTRRVPIHSTSLPSVRLYYMARACALNFLTFRTALIQDTCLCTQLCDLLYGCTAGRVHVHSTSGPSVRMYCTTCPCAFNFVTFCTAVLDDVCLCTQLPDLLYGCTARRVPVHGIDQTE